MIRSIFIFLILSFINGNTFCQSNSYKVIPENYSISTARPLIYFKGDILEIKCDTIYLMNSMRKSFYQKLHEDILVYNDSTCAKLSILYNQSFADLETAYETLLLNSKKANSITSELIEKTKHSLEESQKSLEYTQVTLNQSLKSLELANDYIKKEKWNSSGKKIIAGIGGVAIGLILGLLIAN